MKVGQARMIATSWVKQVASHERGFCGAYFTGSTIHLSDTDVLPETSDVDVIIVTEQEKPGLKLGKFIHSDLLLEVTHMAWSQLVSVENILSSYHLAGSFQKNTIIADPTGALHNIQKAVSEQFTEAVWVRCRYEAALQKVHDGLRGLDLSVPLHEQVMGWLFPTGVMTHALLTAALENPTVRLRYLAVREVLHTYGYDDMYLALLECLGCKHMTAEQVGNHLEVLTDIFDQTVTVSQTPFFFSSDISQAARPIAIDGSRKLIETGNHREAVFWIIATYARCYTILKADGSKALQRLCITAFDEVLADIGIRSTGDLIQRSEQTIDYLPKLRSISEAILLANPHVTKK